MAQCPPPPSNHTYHPCYRACTSSATTCIPPATLCAQVPALYIVLLLLARKPITDSMFEATKLSTALSFLYQVATLTLAP